VRLDRGALTYPGASYPAGRRLDPDAA